MVASHIPCVPLSQCVCPSFVLCQPGVLWLLDQSVPFGLPLCLCLMFRLKPWFWLYTGLNCSPWACDGAARHVNSCPWWGSMERDDLRDSQHPAEEASHQVSTASIGWSSCIVKLKFKYSQDNWTTGVQTSGIAVSKEQYSTVEASQKELFALWESILYIKLPFDHHWSHSASQLLLTSPTGDVSNAEEKFQTLWDDLNL